MTREEAIEHGKEQLEIFGGEHREFIELSIKALEQEPCDKCVYSTKDGYCQYDDITETIPPFEPCRDAVSRKAINNLRKYNLVGGISTVSLKDINKLPPVNPQEPKTDVLDKIRAEIEALNPVDYVSMSSYEGHRGASDMKNDVLQIIDKYKAESEDKE